MGGPPPPMNPPPMTTTGTPNAGAYAPPPGAPPSPADPPPNPAAVPPGDTNVPFNPAVAPPAQVLLLDATTGKLPEGTTLHEGRERCFGKHNEADQMCKECPDWIKQQCRVQTPGGQAQAVDPELAALQNQLEGTPTQ